MNPWKLMSDSVPCAARDAVKSVCPLAFAYWDIPWGWTETWSIYASDANHAQMLGKASSEVEAWEKARETLIEQGELPGRPA